MKRLIIPICVFSFLAGCKDYKPEMERAIMERDSIQLIGEAKDSSINTFLETLTQIEANLDSITQNQEAISEASGENVEFNKDIRERINQNIVFINELLEKNKSMLNSLNEKLRNSNYNIASLKKMIEQLNSDIAAKDSELVVLNNSLAGLRLTVDSLNNSITELRLQNQEKETVISTKENQLNTAYWTIGDYKQLKASNILNKEGGFLGMGKEKVLKKDFNNDGFNQIDITKVKTIEINNKSAKVVTNHPSDSYTLEKDAKGVIIKLEITDPARFWKASKYLVIVTG
jgi:chromosome segregation ATPase